MINPSPVYGKNSPYSQAPGPRVSFPKTIAPPSPKRNWKRGLLLTFMTVLITGATYITARALFLKDSITIAHEGASATALLSYDPTNQNSKLDVSQFQANGQGRFNILIVGIGGGTHPGALLTDTMQVMSIDTINHKIALTSIPRDLFVTIPGYGKSKINAAYEAGESQRSGGGAALDKTVAGSVLGVPISNFVLIDFTGAKQAVDALGGIDINVPTALYDPTFPCDDTIHYCPFSISAGEHHMDGEVALEYARTRHVDSDYGRSSRQQVVIQAMKDKALSVGVLTNPVKVNNLITALGTHIKTDLTLSQISTVLSDYQNASQSTNNVLDDTDAENLLISTTDPVAGFITYPRLGFSNFSAVHAWFAKNNPDPLLTREAATVTVAPGNAYVTTKQLQAEVALLTEYGYNATLSSTPPSRTVNSTEIFDSSNDKDPITHNYLSSQFTLTMQTGSPLNSGSDFEILYVPSTTQK